MPASKSTKSKAKTLPAAPLARPGTKLAKLLTLMQRSQGATVEELAKATGWQKHTVRGAIAGAVKNKLRQKVKVITDGDRRAYAIAKPSSDKPTPRSAVAKPAKAAAKPAAAQAAAE